MTASLFEASAPRPLAERLRPTSREEVVGQDHLLGPDAPIGRMIASRRVSSMILWGPPGCGKTTVARIVAKRSGMPFEALSAVHSGVADLRRVLDAAKDRRRGGQGPTVLFLDEIHRWNKSQQDGLLPFVEDGTVVLVGATTENPSFELNAALLSRASVYVLNGFDDAGLESLLARAERHERRSLPLTAEARRALRAMADGDGRFLLGLCEELFALDARQPLDVEGLERALRRRAPLYDKDSGFHHALLSAFQKSIRGSDVQAALYWLARMLKAGEPPRDVFRRLLVMASEEVAMADPNALQHTVACAEAFDRIGWPEGRMAVAQAVVYLATAPKSNAVYLAIDEALDLAGRTGSVMPPKHILNAPTAPTGRCGRGGGYEYDHAAPHAFSGQEFFPEGMDGGSRPELYRPNERGFEREVVRRMDFWENIRRRRRGG